MSGPVPRTNRRPDPIYGLAPYARAGALATAKSALLTVIYDNSSQYQ